MSVERVKEKKAFKDAVLAIILENGEYLREAGVDVDGMKAELRADRFSFIGPMIDTANHLSEGNPYVKNPLEDGQAKTAIGKLWDLRNKHIQLLAAEYRDMASD